MEGGWDFGAILPNLEVASPLESAGRIALVSAGDSRVQALASHSPAVQALIQDYRDQFGRPRRPSVLLQRELGPTAGDAMVAFRDLIAVQTICSAFSQFDHMPGLRWANYFVFYPIFPGPSNHLATRSPALLALDDPADLNPSTSAEVADSGWSVTAIDEDLQQALLSRWRERFIRKRNARATEQLFRAMHMAFEAATAPPVNTSIYEWGSRIGLWVSAFECLAHPGNGRVGPKHVRLAIEQAPWSDPRLTRRRYAIREGKKTLRVALPAKLYNRLYQARNAFLHGSRVTNRTLTKIGEPAAIRWEKVAPLLFLASLKGIILPQSTSWSGAFRWAAVESALVGGSPP